MVCCGGSTPTSEAVSLQPGRPAEGDVRQTWGHRLVVSRAIAAFAGNANRFGVDLVSRSPPPSSPVGEIDQNRDSEE